MKAKPSSRRSPAEDSDDAVGEASRLQKVLAAAGLGSRRDCEELISAGRVEVDRKVITELGTRVNPLVQEVRVDGEALRRPKRVYFAVNKPIGVVTTNHDPSGRARVIDLVPTDERVFAVGRLDRSSEGLILVTNDGDFANRLTHPRYGVEKTYLVRVAGAPDQRELAKLKRGMHLAEGFARAHSIAVKKSHGQSTDLVIVLNEGRNREIRRILARVGHKVLALKRIAVGGVKLSDLPLGGWRKLSPEEVKALLSAAKVKQREKGSGFRVQGPGKTTLARRASEGNQRQPASDIQYVQKQALLAEPLSLDDLLRDDLDEGPLTSADMPGSGEHGAVEIDGGETTRGGVIDYEVDFSSAPPPSRPKQDSVPARPTRTRHASEARRAKPQPTKPQRAKSQQGKPRQAKPKKPSGSGDNKMGAKRPGQRGGRGRAREKFEGPPSENFGTKRVSKRVFGQSEEGRGAAGEKTGNFRFKPNRKKTPIKAHGADNQRRGERRGAGKQQKQVGKQGGKRKARR